MERVVELRGGCSHVGDLVSMFRTTRAQLLPEKRVRTVEREDRVKPVMADWAGGAAEKTLATQN